MRGLRDKVNILIYIHFISIYEVGSVYFFSLYLEVVNRTIRRLIQLKRTILRRFNSTLYIIYELVDIFLCNT